MKKETVKHEIEPVYDERSRVLILGTMPSPKSRETGFYYGNPQNRFWKALAGVYGTAEPVGKEERKAFALEHGIALWDVLAECEIKGASDASISAEKPNDIPWLLEKTGIKRVYTTGRAAYNYYLRFFKEKTGIEPVYLPSPSGANAGCTLSDLVREYKVIR